MKRDWSIAPRTARALLVGALACGPAVHGRAAAQPQCPPPPSASHADANIFSPEQEIDLGDAMHASLLARFKVIEEQALTSFLTRIGERLLAHMPGESGLKPRFLLSDLPQANAVSLPGGRIYVTRKVVALARDEDELAGVLAHELGHAWTHDAAVTVTRRLRQILGVTRVGDRKDVFDKYHQLLDNVARKPGSYRLTEREADRAQSLADRSAVYALARAGYRPEALADLWDRYNETRGRTGSWLSDLFEITPPASRRLREMLKTQAALPAACLQPAVSTPAEEFRAWQARVVGYSGVGHEEALRHVIWSRPLEPPLQADIDHVRFSPDGRFVLAQDDAGIFVFAREPLALRFRIEAPEAAHAQFSPDSRSVVFHTAGLRVESWDVVSGERSWVYELAPRVPCVQTALSPDGLFLACYDIGRRLSLTEVSSGTTVFERKDFWNWAFVFPVRATIAIEDDAYAVEWVTMAFSPDGRYFVAGAPHTSPAAFDLVARQPLPLRGNFLELTEVNFAFVGPDRLVGVNRADPAKSALVRFPSGELITRLALSRRSRLAGATAGDYLLMRPVDNHPVAVMDLVQRKGVLANKRGAALDLYNDLFVNEAGNGMLDLRRLGKGTADLVERVSLPRGALGRLRAAALSADLKWLAVSQRGRGAAWDLERGQRVLHLRGFRGAYIDGGAVLHADIPKQGEVERALTRMDLVQGGLLGQRTFATDARTLQLGGLLVVTRFEKPSDALALRPKGATLEVLDVVSDARLWTRAFPSEFPSVFVGPDGATLALVWPVSEQAAQDVIRREPALKARLATMQEQLGDYLIEIQEIRSGLTRGHVLVETGKGSFGIRRVAVSGDWLALEGTDGRTAVYSIASGDVAGRIFGHDAILAAERGLLCVEIAPGRLAIHALAGLEKRDELLFAHPVSLAGFSADGKRLLVLTADQTAHMFDATQW